MKLIISFLICLMVFNPTFASQILDCKSDPKGCGESLIEAVRYDFQEQAIQSLINNGANVNYQNSNGLTALMSAVESQRPYVFQYMKLLINAGALPNIKDNKGRAAIHYAFKGTYSSPEVTNITEDILSVLSDYGADLNTVDNQKNSLYHYVVATQNGFESNKLNVLNFLILKSADPNLRNTNGETALVLASKLRDRSWEETRLTAPILASFVKAGMDINTQDSNGRNALFYLISDRDDVVFRTLLDLKININLNDNIGVTPLMAQGVVSHVEALLERGANPNSICCRSPYASTTPLISAIELGVRSEFIVEYPESPQIITKLGKFGVNVNFKLDDERGRGDTAIIRAARYGFPESVKTLLALGADPNIRNARGHTAVSALMNDSFKPYMRQETLQILKDAGGIP